jgi:hypothetical protein
MEVRAYLASRRMIKQPVAHHDVITTRDQRHAVQRLCRIGFEPSDSSFSPNLLLGFDPESKHGGRDVEDIHELCAQFDGFSRVLAFPAAEVEDC